MEMIYGVTILTIIAGLVALWAGRQKKKLDERGE